MACAIGGLAALPAAASAAQTAGFAVDYSTGEVSQFTIGSGGALGANGTAGGGESDAWFDSVTPNGEYLYVANTGDASVSEYSISSSGTVTSLASQPSIDTTGDPYQTAVSPDGQNLYVANLAGELLVYDIASDGMLTLAQTETSDISASEGVAVSPDGSSVYVDDGSNGIVEFNRASDGTLTPKTTATIAGPSSQYGDIAITPNGQYLYASAYYGDAIYEYSIGSGGELSALSTPSVLESDVYGMIVSPNGENVYSNNCAATDQYTISSDGELTLASSTAGGCGLLWMTADGASLYVPDYGASEVDEYDVSSSGALTPKSGSPVTTAGGTEPWGFIIPPDQAPVAAFTATAARAGKATKFNGSASASSGGGTITDYDWRFGDGKKLTDGGATPSHKYAKAGTYTVTLTVTDESGCSTAQVFTGQTAYCNGSSQATVSHRVKVAAAVKSLKLAVSPGQTRAGKRTCFTFTASSSSRHVSGVKVRFDGHTAKTRGTGKAVLCLAPKKGTYRATATKAGYATAHATATVKAARKTSAGFTG